MLFKSPFAAILIVFFILLGGCDDSQQPIDKPGTPAPVPEESSRVVILEQGWNKDEMLDFYNTPQGSQLLPYSWFLALEQVSKSDLFRDNKHIKSFGYIPQVSTPGRNPDGLPIGFVKDIIQEDFLASALTATRISSRPQGNQMEWLGLTCAACHTSESARHQNIRCRQPHTHIPCPGAF